MKGNALIWFSKWSHQYYCKHPVLTFVGIAPTTLEAYKLWCDNAKAKGIREVDLPGHEIVEEEPK